MPLFRNLRYVRTVHRLHRYHILQPPATQDFSSLAFRAFDTFDTRTSHAIHVRSLINTEEKERENLSIASSHIIQITFIILKLHPSSPPAGLELRNHVRNMQRDALPHNRDPLLDH